MKKALIILLTIMMMVVSACSSAAGGNSEGTQTKSEGQTGTKPPKEETVEPKNSNEKKTIVFSTFFQNDFFVEAKKKYEAKHPNITIDLKYIDTEDADLEVNLEKFIKTTGTALLSGKGPDLIEMDQLPSGDYIKKQLLVNMSELIDKDPTFKKEQYFGNILDGMKVNGGLYGMPLGFFIYGLFGNNTLIEKSGVKIDDSHWNWTQFIETARELVKHTDENQTVLGTSQPEYMITQLVNDQYGTFVDKESGKANFDSAAFTDLLKEVKSVFDDKIMSGDKGFPIFRDTQINSPDDYIREIKQSEFLTGGLSHKTKLYLKPIASGQQAGGSFRTYQTLGINAKSSVKEEAWDFLKFMHSDEMQHRAGSAGFPLSKASYNRVVQDVLKKGTVESDQPMGPMKGKVFEITQKDIDDLDKFLTGAKYSVQFNNTHIDDIVREESLAYFAGQKTPEAVAKLIQNRVTTVLNE